MNPYESMQTSQPEGSNRNLSRALTNEKLTKLENQNKEPEIEDVPEIIEKIAEEFSMDPFTIEDLKEVVDVSASSLEELVAEGYLDYDEDTGEYQATPKTIEKVEE